LGSGVPYPYAYRCPYGSSTPQECGERSVREVAKLLDLAMERVSPPSSWSQCRHQRHHRPGQLLAACEITRARRLLIADEIMSGFAAVANGSRGSAAAMPASRI
jgi:4-aminobutyrate aminotransferase-like enzyme